MENVKEKSQKNQRTLTMILFGIYFFVLIWAILFKMEFSFKYLHSPREVNLIPFADSMIINNKVSLLEIYMNIIAFVPFGVYIAMLKPNWSFLKKVAPIALTSMLVETLQYIFAIGAADITDFIGNTVGGIIGIIIYLIAYKLFKTNMRTNKIFNILMLIGTVGFILLAGLITLANI